MTHDEISEMMRRLDDMQYAGQWADLDALFAAVDVETADPTQVIVYLRHTFMAATKEDRFTEWNNLVSRAREHYNRLDGRGDSMLRGLY